MRKKYFIVQKNEVPKGDKTFYPTLLDLNIDGTLIETQNYMGDVDPKLLNEKNVVFAFTSDGMTTLVDWYVWHVISKYAKVKTKFLNLFFRMYRTVASVFAIVSIYILLGAFLYDGKYVKGSLALFVFIYNIAMLEISDHVCEHELKPRHMPEFLISTPIYFTVCAVVACILFPNKYVLCAVPAALAVILLLYFFLYKYIKNRKRLIEYDIY